MDDNGEACDANLQIFAIQQNRELPRQGDLFQHVTYTKAAP
jgi:hypothetical protein